MGIDFIGVNAHWSYSGFHRFRERVAREIDIELMEMMGFGGQKSWEHIKNPLVYFLDHSDCGGEISAERCREIAPILKQIISNWKDDDYDKQEGLKLIEGMENCAKENKPLIFC